MQKDWRKRSRKVVVTVYLAFSIGAATVLTKYNEILEQRLEKDVRSWTLDNTWDPQTVQLYHSSTDWMSNLTPVAFVVACVIYFVSFALVYQFQKADRYQDRFIVGGLSIAAILGASRGQCPRAIALCIAPWGASAGLMLSVAVHGVLDRRKQLQETRKAQCEADMEKDGL